MLQVFHTREQHAGIAHQDPTGFEQHPDLLLSKALEECAEILSRRRGLFIAIADAKTATEIEVMD